METFIIIKSSKTGQENWSGKEFSSNPAKIYSSFEDASESLKSYWFNSEAIEFNNADNRVVDIVHLSLRKKDKLLSKGDIRW